MYRLTWSVVMPTVLPLRLRHRAMFHARCMVSCCVHSCVPKGAFMTDKSSLTKVSPLPHTAQGTYHHPPTLLRLFLPLHSNYITQRRQIIRMALCTHTETPTHTHIHTHTFTHVCLLFMRIHTSTHIHAIVGDVTAVAVVAHACFIQPWYPSVFTRYGRAPMPHFQLLLCWLR